jgi:hypothetical protein
MAVYVLAGALHGFCELDVMHASGRTIVSSIKHDVDPSEKGVVDEHHCHGCFSVSLPASMAAAAGVELTLKTAVPIDVLRSGLPPGIDPPPPKFLA